MRYYKVALDVPAKVKWANAKSNKPVPNNYAREIVNAIFPVEIYSLDPSKKATIEDKLVVPPTQVVERPTDAVDIAAMVLKAAQAGDGEAAVKLAQMASLMKKYG